MLAQRGTVPVAQATTDEAVLPERVQEVLGGLVNRVYRKLEITRRAQIAGALTGLLEDSRDEQATAVRLFRRTPPAKRLNLRADAASGRLWETRWREHTAPDPRRRTRALRDPRHADRRDRRAARISQMARAEQSET